MQEISISVIMPTYNSSGYIIRTMDTIYQQTRLPDEVIIVDDGSEDNTVKIVQNYIDRHKDVIKNIKIFTQKNQGAAAARNYCIKNVTSEWVAFLDSDDIWDKRKLEAVERVIVEHPEITVIAHDEYAVNEKDLSDRKLCELHKNYNPREDLFLQLYRGNFLSTSCMTIRKDILEQAGGFDDSLRSAQDYDLWIRVGKYGKLYYIEEPLETYVTRPGNISSNVYRRYECELKICRKYISEIIQMMGEKKAKKAVRKKVFYTHIAEAYLALKGHKYRDMLRIIVRLPKEYMIFGVQE